MEIELVLIGISVSLFFILIVLMFVLAFQAPPKKSTRSVQSDLQKIKEQIVSVPRKKNNVYNAQVEEV